MEMVTVTIQAEARAKYKKTIKTTKNAANGIMRGNEETIIDRLDFEDIEEIIDHELLSISVTSDS